MDGFSMPEKNHTLLAHNFIGYKLQTVNLQDLLELNNKLKHHRSEVSNEMYAFADINLTLTSSLTSFILYHCSILK